MVYRITTTWNDGAVSVDTRTTWASATKVANRNRRIAAVVGVVIGSASSPVAAINDANDARPTPSPDEPAA